MDGGVRGGYVGPRGVGTWVRVGVVGVGAGVGVRVRRGAGGWHHLDDEAPHGVLGHDLRPAT